MFNIEVVDELISHIEVSRHQKNLRLRLLKRKKKEKTREHWAYVETGIESMHPNEEITLLIDQRLRAKNLIKFMKKMKNF